MVLRGLMGDEDMGAIGYNPFADMVARAQRDVKTIQSTLKAGGTTQQAAEAAAAQHPGLVPAYRTPSNPVAALVPGLDLTGGDSPWYARPTTWIAAVVGVGALALILRRRKAA